MENKKEKELEMKKKEKEKAVQLCEQPAVERSERRVVESPVEQVVLARVTVPVETSEQHMNIIE